MKSIIRNSFLSRFSFNWNQGLIIIYYTLLYLIIKLMLVFRLNYMNINKGLLFKDLVKEKELKLNTASSCIE